MPRFGAPPVPAPAGAPGKGERAPEAPEALGAAGGRCAPARPRAGWFCEGAVRPDHAPERPSFGGCPVPPPDARWPPASPRAGWGWDGAMRPDHAPEPPSFGDCPAPRRGPAAPSPCRRPSKSRTWGSGVGCSEPPSFGATAPCAPVPPSGRRCSDTATPERDRPRDDGCVRPAIRVMASGDEPGATRGRLLVPGCPPPPSTASRTRDPTWRASSSSGSTSSSPKSLGRSVSPGARIPLAPRRRDADTCTSSWAIIAADLASFPGLRARCTTPSKVAAGRRSVSSAAAAAGPVRIATGPVTPSARASGSNRWGSATIRSGPRRSSSPTKARVFFVVGFGVLVRVAWGVGRGERAGGLGAAGCAT